MNKNTHTKSLILSFMSIAVLAGFQTTEVHALGLVKVNNKAARGLCLPDRTESVRSVLQRNKILLFTGNNRKPSKGNKTGVSNRRKLGYGDGRAKAVANVIHAVDHIGDGKFTAHKGVRMVFGNPGRSSANSRRTLYDIQLNPGNQNMLGTGRITYGGTDNRALIAHELGHYVGRKLYQPYFRAVRGTCRLTGYARKNRNEEFSEVFAAYITNPSLLAGKGRNCDKAFNFFARQFGEKNINKSCSSRLKSLNNKSGAISTSIRPQLREDNIPIPTPRPEARPDDLVANFELPELEKIPIPLKRPDDPNGAQYTEEDRYTTPSEASKEVEYYYTEVFYNYPIVAQTEEEHAEDEAHAIEVYSEDQVGP